MRLDFSSPIRCILGTVAALAALPSLAAATPEAAAGPVASPEVADEAAIRFATFNIRYDNPRDGRNRWIHRRETSARFIREMTDIAGLQEVLPSQWQHLRDDLPDFDGEFRVRRADPDANDEACPILWRRGRFERVDGGTFWLSDTPESPGSSTWGNNLPRIATWVDLRDRRTDKVWHVINIHFDHATPEARVRSAQLLAERSGGREGLLVLLGDFNAGINSLPMRHLIEEGGFADTSSDDEYPGTANGWREDGPFHHIDFILTRGPLRIVERAEVHRWRTPGGGWISDHFPVAASLAADDASPDPMPAPRTSND